jgi:hypothetical protein
VQITAHLLFPFFTSGIVINKYKFFEVISVTPDPGSEELSGKLLKLLIGFKTCNGIE